MKYMENRKGQGFDTFKLLIAAVVAMVILGIVTGVFGKIWAMIAGIQCVSSPINELMTTLQDAQSGMRATTQDICLDEGAGVGAAAIANTMSNIGTDDITFKCDSAAVCEEGGPLAISLDGKEIDAEGDATFKAVVECIETGGNYKCTISIRNA